MGNDSGALAGTFGEYDQDDKEADEVRIGKICVELVNISNVMLHANLEQGFAARMCFMSLIWSLLSLRYGKPLTHLWIRGGRIREKSA